MTVQKGQSMERGNKRVRLERASEACVFVIEPAFKTYSSGDQVSSGDVSSGMLMHSSISLWKSRKPEESSVCGELARLTRAHESTPGDQMMFRSFERISGAHLYLNMSRNTAPTIAQNWLQLATRQLQVCLGCVRA